MKKITISLALLLISVGYNAQVGVNTELPLATLDIVGKPGITTIADGVIAPRLSLANLNSKAAAYTASQTGAIVYVNDIAGSTSTSTVNVKTLGYYYYDGTIWIKLNSTSTPITASNGLTKDATSGDVQLGGTLSKATTIQQGTNNLTLVNTTATPTGNKVGIATNTPNSTLAVDGSLETAYKEVTATTTTLTASDYYITYNGTAVGTITLPVVGIGTTSFTGRIYRIKNVSAFNITIQASSGNTLRADATTVNTFTISPGTYIEVVNNANTTGTTWDVSFVGKPTNNNVELYGAQVKIPPHSGSYSGSVPDFINHVNTNFDTGSGTDIWWVISKSSSSSSLSSSNYWNSSKMTIVYEYQGTAFNVTNMYPMLTAGNDGSYPDVYTASFVSLANIGTPAKTRLTVTVARADYAGRNFTNYSDWSGTFLLNILLARKIN